MAITKIQSESMNLADTYAFTGTVTGAGETNTPAFYARASSNQTFTDATFNKVVVDTEDLDTDNAFASSRFTVPSGKGGLYTLSAQVRSNTQNDGSEYNMAFFLNGSIITRGASKLMVGGSTGMYHVNTTIVDLDAGDYVEAYFYPDASSNTTSESGYVFFAGYKITQ